MASLDQKKSTCHFKLLPDGGVIEITANDPFDVATRNAIQQQVVRIAGMLTEGNFAIPMLVHRQQPPGIDTMKRLKNELSYAPENLPNGGRVRIATSNPAARSAVYDSLRFEIQEHKTGDSLAEASPAKRKHPAKQSGPRRAPGATLSGQKKRSSKRALERESASHVVALMQPTKGFLSWRLHNLVEAAPVCRRTQVTVGTDRQIKHGHVGQAGAVLIPSCTAVGRKENAPVSTGVEMGRICRIDHECVHRNVGNPSVHFRPRDSAGARIIEIGGFKDVGNAIPVVGDQTLDVQGTRLISFEIRRSRLRRIGRRVGLGGLNDRGNA